MVHYSRVIKGIADYVDSELVGSLAGSWKAWLLGSMAGVAASKAEDMFHQYKDMPVLASLGLIDGENINVDAIFTELRKQAQKGKATISLPIIGPITFGTADVEALYHKIKGA
jgi:hypothetical protein